MITDVSICSCHSQFDVAFLGLGQTRCWPVGVNKSYPGLSEHRRWMLRRLERTVFNKRRNTSTVRLLTIDDHAHILDEAMENMECLSCGSSGFILCESFQPLQDRLDTILLEKILYRFDCVLLSKITLRRERTHTIVAA